MVLKVKDHREVSSEMQCFCTPERISLESEVDLKSEVGLGIRL